MKAYSAMLAKFALYHTSSGNVWCHLATTLVGLVGFAGVVSRCFSTKGSSAVSLGVWVAYAGSLFVVLEEKSTAATCACAVVSVALLAAKLDLGWSWSLALVAAGYALQDASHWYFGEETYQANSWGGKTFVAELFFEHCYYLLPLILDCSSKEARIAARCLPLLFLSWANYALDSDSLWGMPFVVGKRRLLVGKLERPEELGDMKTVRDWVVLEKKPAVDTTSHWWPDTLPATEAAAFERLVQSETIEALFRAKFGEKEYVVEPVRGMNEIYVSAPKKKTGGGKKSSDDVFFTQHVDGPFCFFPFASVYRCILALDANKEGFTTRFPLALRDVTAKNGDVLAFDFHRESHYITREGNGMDADEEDRFRVVLKLHYVAAPSKLFFFGASLRWLSVKYNQLFRALFLFTLVPQSKAQTALADFGVVGFTVLYNAAEKYCGFGNVAYYAALAVTALVLRSYSFFLYATQFLHYLRYITTYYDRRNVAYGAFKRDVLLYKTVALAQLLALYAFDFNVLSLPFVVVGYAISIAATQALGVDGTYFGIELDVVKADYRFVTKFPYNVLPHPMILGQVLAIAAMHLGGRNLQRNYPLLAPLHVLLYLAHLTQEAFDLHDGVPWYKKVANAKTTKVN